MRHKIFKQATALLLALVTAMSLVTVSFAGKTATGQGSQGNSGGGTAYGPDTEMGDHKDFSDLPYGFKN